MARQTQLTIDLNALHHNLQVVRSLVGNSGIMAIIKSNAYGHGALEAAKALHEADMFGVATLEEAIALRLAGVEKAILLLEGFHEPADLPEIANLSLDIVVHCETQLKTLLAMPLPSPVTVWLKMDSGMHRLGLPASMMGKAYAQLQDCPHVMQVKLMSHFASADAPDNPFSLQQISAFDHCTSGLSAEVSLCNSAALVHYPAAHRNWVRPGIMLYGGNPFSYPTYQNHPITEQLKPVMTFHSRIIALRKVPAGESVGYGQRWTAKSDSTIATLAVGYADGYPRHAPSGTPVMVNGHRVPLVGTVSMDLITVDVTALDTVNIGDRAILWGEGLPAEEIAERCGTINYTLFTGIGNRVSRQYLALREQS